MELYAFSVFSQRQRFENGVTHFDQKHTCAMLEAVDREHAEGKGMKIARKLFPLAEGWNVHHVAISTAENVVTVDDVVLKPGEF